MQVARPALDQAHSATTDLHHQTGIAGVRRQGRHVERERRIVQPSRLHAMCGNQRRHHIDRCGDGVAACRGLHRRHDLYRSHLRGFDGGGDAGLAACVQRQRVFSGFGLRDAIALDRDARLYGERAVARLP